MVNVLGVEKLPVREVYFMIRETKQRLRQHGEVLLDDIVMGRDWQDSKRALEAYRDLLNLLQNDLAKLYKPAMESELWHSRPFTRKGNNG